MSFVINTNIQSLQAQNNLNSTQQSLNQSIQRLSSGSKINSAKDDAAGQAIANRLSSQINGLSQASSNANDGISLAQTTEGALNQVNDNLQRVRELTVQAANGTNSQSDLNSLQQEIGQRLSEIDRVSDQTAFNGIHVLDGSKDSISIQVGSKDGQTISIDLQQTDSKSLGLDKLDVTNLAKSVSAGGYDDGTNVAADDATFALTDSNGGTTDGFSVVNGSDGNTYVRNADGDSYAATLTSSDSNSDGTYDSVAVAYDSSSPVTDATAKDAGLNPLADIDSALTQINDTRSGLGAVQNRFDSAISNITTTKANITSARSRIEDTNYASEVSKLSKAKILQQAGTSVLAQANQTSQGVLSLLQSA